jgi:hypothetical protein
MAQSQVPPEELELSQGLMCCDQSGLCLKKKGDINPLLSGTYTAMIRLASQLEGFETTPTVISMETDQSRTIIKQYDGHTVVMKVPALDDSHADSEDVQGDKFINDAPADDLVTDERTD